MMVDHISNRSKGTAMDIATEGDVAVMAAAAAVITGMVTGKVVRIRPHHQPGSRHRPLLRASPDLGRGLPRHLLPISRAGADTVKDIKDTAEATTVMCPHHHPRDIRLGDTVVATKAATRVSNNNPVDLLHLDRIAGMIGAMTTGITEIGITAVIEPIHSLGSELYCRRGGKVGVKNLGG